ncbi:MAG: perilipin family protein [Clostridium sp.]|nr:perilipin family protein [Clostridium sp.]
MKKMFIVAAISLVGIFASCSSTERSKVEDIDPVGLAEKIKTTKNADSLKLYIEAAKIHAAQLADENKLDSARAYLDQVMPVVQERDPGMLDSFKSVEGVIKSAAATAVESSESFVSEVGDSVVSKSDTIVSRTKDAVSGAVQTGREKVSDAVQTGKDAVKGAAEKVGDKASDAARSVGDKAKEIFN